MKLTLWGQHWTKRVGETSSTRDIGGHWLTIENPCRRYFILRLFLFNLARLNMPKYLMKHQIHWFSIATEWVRNPCSWCFIKIFLYKGTRFPKIGGAHSVVEIGDRFFMGKRDEIESATPLVYRGKQYTQRQSGSCRKVNVAETYRGIQHNEVRTFCAW